MASLLVGRWNADRILKFLEEIFYRLNYMDFNSFNISAMLL